jgi:AI-2 transport protein TqsA
MTEPARRDMATLGIIALCLVIVATSWFLLQQLAVLLRPLLLAIFLAYIILPIHYRLTERIPRFLSVVVLAGASMGVLYGLALMIYSSAVDLSEDLPRYVARATKIYDQVNGLWNSYFSWMSTEPSHFVTSNDRLNPVGTWLVNTATDALAEAVVVGFYLLFLLLEAHRFPERIRSNFQGGRGDEILRVAGRVNGAIAAYLKAKVQASLILAAPVTLVLWACGVRFPLLWGVLTFLCNFIPYLGSIAAVSLPLAFAFLDLDPGWRPVAALVGVLSTHLIMTYLVEPTITSKAVGLSPLVILFALAFWGQCWGLIGMFLAVPLTVMLKIVLENIAETRPIAGLLGDQLGEPNGQPAVVAAAEVQQSGRADSNR